MVVTVVASGRGVPAERLVLRMGSEPATGGLLVAVGASTKEHVDFGEDETRDAEGFCVIADEHETTATRVTVEVFVEAAQENSCAGSTRAI